MGRYFGTDGIRGKANETLTVERAFKVGCYVGYYYSQKGKKNILIGKDTRRSSDMFESALAAGIAACGCDVYLAGYCPTPMVAYLVTHKDFECGVMVSASHNPYYDNGIKIFSHDGVKLSAEIEGLIEDYIDGKSEIKFATNDAIGKVIPYLEGIELYLNWLQTSYPLDLKGIRCAVDCANGSASFTAVTLLTRMGAEVTAIHNTPDGLNINTHCGSTHPEDLQALVKSGNFDCGFAFDGDADRLIATDEKGELITGDHVLYFCGKFLKDKGELSHDTVVTTVMANLGLFKALEKEGIHDAVTQVGDKYVYEEMCAHDYAIGGEQSGHIIFKDYLTTGDGLQTALNILRVMKDTKKKVSVLSEGLTIYPQLLVNVKVADKNQAMEDTEVLAETEKVKNELGDEGRILVRTSGTEPLVRVMVEAKTDALCHDMVYRVVEILERKYKV